MVKLMPISYIILTCHTQLSLSNNSRLRNSKITNRFLRIASLSMLRGVSKMANI
jgi:hypothetical protein